MYVCSNRWQVLRNRIFPPIPFYRRKTENGFYRHISAGKQSGISMISGSLRKNSGIFRFAPTAAKSEKNRDKFRLRAICQRKFYAYLLHLCNSMCVAIVGRFCAIEFFRRFPSIAAKLKMVFTGIFQWENRREFL